MTPVEFKAWMQGVDVVLKGAPPSAELWALIREEVANMATPAPWTPPPAVPAPWGLEGPVVVKKRWLDTPTPPFKPPYEITCRDTTGSVASGTVEQWLGERKGDRDAR